MGLGVPEETERELTLERRVLHLVKFLSPPVTAAWVVRSQAKSCAATESGG